MELSHAGAGLAGGLPGPPALNGAPSATGINGAVVGAGLAGALPGIGLVNGSFEDTVDGEGNNDIDIQVYIF